MESNFGRVLIHPFTFRAILRFISIGIKTKPELAFGLKHNHIKGFAWPDAIVVELH